MFSKFKRNLRSILRVFPFVFLVIPLHGNAVFIDFDDIELREFDSDLCFFSSGPCGLDNQYEDKGIIFGEELWLQEKILPDGTLQKRVHSQFGIKFSFIGMLPNYLSFNIDSSQETEASFISIYDINNELILLTRSGGWIGSDAASTPYIPGELIIINSPAPIKYVYITSYYGLRHGPKLDNLTFEYKTVPEPSPPILLLIGMTGLFLRRHLIQINKNQSLIKYPGGLSAFENPS
jgi:hypothetical protein